LSQLDTDSRSASARRLAILIPGVAMCLGWGLRGQYGGPRGAMVPGALVAMALAITARRRLGPAQFWAIAMAGALGFGIGGEETYMQTVSIATHPGSPLWGYLGLFIKGAVWGGTGGLFIGAAISGKYTARQLLIAFNIALIVSFAAHAIINEPRLIYFSGHVSDKPKREGWAGSWAFFLVLLGFAAYYKDRTAVRLAAFGTFGCGFGFMIGVFANHFGDVHLGKMTTGYWDWWKVAECGFGLIGGLVLGWGWSTGPQPEPEASSTSCSITLWPCILLALDLLLFYYVTDKMEDLPGWIGDAPFVFTAPFLILAASGRPALQFGIGVSMPIVLTLWNMESYWVEECHKFSGTVGLAGLILFSAIAAAHVSRLAQRPVSSFLAVAWWTTACAWVKMGYPAPSEWGTMIVVQGIFTVMAIWLTLVTRERRPGVAGAVVTA
jgi:hypothetical protein